MPRCRWTSRGAFRPTGGPIWPASPRSSKQRSPVACATLSTEPSDLIPLNQRGARCYEMSSEIRNLDRSSDRGWPVLTGTVRNHQTRRREQMNPVALTGTASDGFVNHRSWVRVPPSAQENRTLPRICPRSDLSSDRNQTGKLRDRQAPCAITRRVLFVSPDPLDTKRLMRGNRLDHLNRRRRREPRGTARPPTE